MSTQLIPRHLVEDGTIAESTRTSLGAHNDPQRRRYGYAPGAWLMEIEPLLSGRQHAAIPQGRPVLFKSATLRVENFDIEKPQWEPTKSETFPAALFIQHVKDRFTKPESDWGFRELDVLTPLDPEKRAADGTVYDEALPYFAAVHPSFEALGHECQAGLEVCPTCRIDFLEDEAGIRARVAAAGLDGEIAELLRLRLLESNVTFRDHAAARWAEIVGEMDEVKNGGDRGLKGLKQGEHHIRRCLHALAPEDRAADVAASYGAQSGGAILEGMREIADSLRQPAPENAPDPTQAATLTVLQQIAESLQKTNERMDRLEAERAAQPETKTKGR